ncbi:phospholipid scramblase 2-like [Contarinia nasturtii]|uniref:phospholipid scramblase 2-like n=1 Tax=Contarinia nasturtii TaxID=265458 RepID=UPI0012D482F3|nr:phospholipid scramblase 2-like [Contarinia nasturtii]
MSCSGDSNCDVNESSAGQSHSEHETTLKRDQSEEKPETDRHLQSIVSQPQPSANLNDCNPNESFNCPPGLEYLAPIEQLFLKLKLGRCMGFEKNIKFDIKDSTGQIIYQANECSECFTRCCYGSNRPFNMKVYDLYQREVLHLKRPCTFSGFCGPHFPESLKISAAGQMFGRVEEDLNYPQFVVKNLFDETVLRIEGPFCSSGGNVEFQIYSANGKQVSQISKHGVELTHDLTTDTDNFAIDFIRDLDVFQKAAIVGVTIFIDSMFFERKSNNSE